MPRTRCLRGHDLTLPDARAWGGRCRLCRRASQPYTRARQDADARYAASTKGILSREKARQRRKYGNQDRD